MLFVFVLEYLESLPAICNLTLREDNQTPTFFSSCAKEKVELEEKKVLPLYFPHPHQTHTHTPTTSPSPLTHTPQSLRIKNNNSILTLNLHTPPSLPLRIPKRQSPTAVAFGGSNPQSQKMPPRMRWREILISGSCM